MLKINTTTFNPQILYIANCYTNEVRVGENHHHDFWRSRLFVRETLFMILKASESS